MYLNANGTKPRISHLFRSRPRSSTSTSADGRHPRFLWENAPPALLLPLSPAELPVHTGNDQWKRKRWCKLYFKNITIRGFPHDDTNMETVRVFVAPSGLWWPALKARGLLRPQRDAWFSTGLGRSLAPSASPYLDEYHTTNFFFFLELNPLRKVSEDLKNLLMADLSLCVWGEHRDQSCSSIQGYWGWASGGWVAGPLDAKENFLWVPSSARASLSVQEKQINW